MDGIWGGMSATKRKREIVLVVRINVVPSPQASVRVCRAGTSTGTCVISQDDL